MLKSAFVPSLVDFALSFIIIIIIIIIRGRKKNTNLAETNLALLRLALCSR
jgi:ABC-type polysaccharide/polyol phosphate export permease